MDTRFPKLKIVIDENSSISQLKERITNESSDMIEVNLQRLIYNGRILKATHHRTIVGNRLKNHCTILLVRSSGHQLQRTQSKEIQSERKENTDLDDNERQSRRKRSQTTTTTETLSNLDTNQGYARSVSPENRSQLANESKPAKYRSISPNPEIFS